MVNEATLINNGNSKQFLFKTISPVINKKSQPVVAIPLINTSSSSTIYFRFSGQQEDVSFTFALWDDGTDVSNGTDVGVPTTVDEQVLYLRDEIFTEEYNTDWTLTMDRYYPTGTTLTGVLTDLQYDNESGSVTVVTGSLTLKRGTIGNLS